MVRSEFLLFPTVCVGFESGIDQSRTIV